MYLRFMLFISSFPKFPKQPKSLERETDTSLCYRFCRCGDWVHWGSCRNIPWPAILGWFPWGLSTLCLFICIEPYVICIRKWYLLILFSHLWENRWRLYYVLMSLLQYTTKLLLYQVWGLLCFGFSFITWIHKLSFTNF